MKVNIAFGIVVLLIIFGYFLTIDVGIDLRVNNEKTIAKMTIEGKSHHKFKVFSITGARSERIFIKEECLDAKKEQLEEYNDTFFETNKNFNFWDLRIDVLSPVHIRGYIDIPLENEDQIDVFIEKLRVCEMDKESQRVAQDILDSLLLG